MIRTLLKNTDIQISYDPEVRAAYIGVRAGKVTCSREVKPGIVMDLDGKGRLLGVEVIDPARIEVATRVVLKNLSSKFHIPALAAVRPEALPRLYARPIAA